LNALYRGMGAAQFAESCPNAREANVTSDNNEPRIVVPTQRARQGVTGQNVRYVLGLGLVSAIIAFALIYWIYF
jgi:hypothetical protein